MTIIGTMGIAVVGVARRTLVFKKKLPINNVGPHVKLLVRSPQRHRHQMQMDL
jgi:hypothetical protein